MLADFLRVYANSTRLALLQVRLDMYSDGSKMYAFSTSCAVGAPLAPIVRPWLSTIVRYVHPGFGVTVSFVDGTPATAALLAQALVSTSRSQLVVRLGRTPAAASSSSSSSAVPFGRPEAIISEVCSFALFVFICLSLL